MLLTDRLTDGRIAIVMEGPASIRPVSGYKIISLVTGYAVKNKT